MTSTQPWSTVTVSTQSWLLVTPVIHSVFASSDSCNPVWAHSDSCNPVLAHSNSQKKVLAHSDSWYPVLAYFNSQMPVFAHSDSQKPVLAHIESHKPVLAYSHLITVHSDTPWQCLLQWFTSGKWIWLQWIYRIPGWQTALIPYKHYLQLLASKDVQNIIIKCLPVGMGCYTSQHFAVPNRIDNLFADIVLYHGERLSKNILSLSSSESFLYAFPVTISFLVAGPLQNVALFLAHPKDPWLVASCPASCPRHLQDLRIGCPLPLLLGTTPSITVLSKPLRRLTWPKYLNSYRLWCSQGIIQCSTFRQTGM